MKGIFEEYESDVRYYCRVFPEIFKTAKDSIIKDINDKQYIDFWCGAGAVNLGHNNEYIKSKIQEYLAKDKIVHALDMMTEEKAEFISNMRKKILMPKKLEYKFLFPNPTGTNAVEAAAKVARKATGRELIWSFMGGFHGMTLGALALTSDNASRRGGGCNLGGGVHIPAPYMVSMDVIEYMEMLLADDHSGMELPAAIIMETVQAEGGVYVFNSKFMKNIRKFCDKYEILLIVDDIQVGVCRSGNFFSFERAEIVPDIVILSKSIGGYGIPFSLLLLKPEIDLLNPGEHNGTFRGNQLAMVTANATIDYIIAHDIENAAVRKGQIIKEYLKRNIPPEYDVRGIGMIWGIDFKEKEKCMSVASECFERGLIIEKAGRNESVLKLMPALTIDEALLQEGMDIIKGAMQ